MLKSNVQKLYKYKQPKEVMSLKVDDLPCNLIRFGFLIIYKITNEKSYLLRVQIRCTSLGVLKYIDYW